MQPDVGLSYFSAGAFDLVTCLTQGSLVSCAGMAFPRISTARGWSRNSFFTKAKAIPFLSEGAKNSTGHFPGFLGSGEHLVVLAGNVRPFKVKPISFRLGVLFKASRPIKPPSFSILTAQPNPTSKGWIVSSISFPCRGKPASRRRESLAPSPQGVTSFWVANNPRSWGRLLRPSSVHNHPRPCSRWP